MSDNLPRLGAGLVLRAIGAGAGFACASSWPSNVVYQLLYHVWWQIAKWFPHAPTL